MFDIVKRIHTYLITFLSKESFFAFTFAAGVTRFTCPSIWVAITFCKINSPYHFFDSYLWPNHLFIFQAAKCVCVHLGGSSYHNIAAEHAATLKKVGFCRNLLLYKWTSEQLKTFFIKIRFPLMVYPLELKLKCWVFCK